MNRYHLDIKGDEVILEQEACAYDVDDVSVSDGVIDMTPDLDGRASCDHYICVPAEDELGAFAMAMAWLKAQREEQS